MTDTLTLFHATHGNVAGTATALSVTSLSTARTAMRRQIGLKGEILALEPSALLVPPELETTAQQLVAQLLATKTSDVNPFANGLQIIVEPGLTSAIAWYLLADVTADRKSVCNRIRGIQLEVDRSVAATQYDAVDGQW